MIWVRSKSRPETGHYLLPGAAPLLQTQKESSILVNQVLLLSKFGVPSHPLPSPHHLREVEGSCPLVGQGCLHTGVRGAADSVPGLPWRLSGKESACKAGDAGDMGLIPESGRSPGGGHSNPLQNSCLENPMDRGAWWATVHRVAKTRLSN